MNRKSLKQNMFYNAIFRISNILFPLITFPYITRILQTDGFGKISFSQSVADIFLMFASLGMMVYATKECAKHRDNPHALVKCYYEILVITIIASLVSIGAYILLTLVIPSFQPYSGIMLLYSGYIIFNALNISWLYEAVEQYNFIAFRNLIIKAIFTVLVFVFIKKPEHVSLYCVLLVFSALGTLIVNYLKSKSILRYKLTGKLQLKSHIKAVAVFFFINLAINIYASMDKVMLGLMTNDTLVGQYTAANKMILMAASVISALITALLPRIMVYTKSGSYEKIKQVLSKLFRYILVLVMPIYLLFSLQSNRLIVFLAGEEYAPAGIAMKILSILFILKSLGNMVGNVVLISHGKEKMTLIAVIGGLVANITLNLLLIPSLNFTGASIACVSAEGISLLIMSWMGWQYIRAYIPWRSAIITIIASLAVSATYHAVIGFMPQGLFINLALTSLILLTVYGLILFILKEESLIELIGEGRNLMDRVIKKSRRDDLGIALIGASINVKKHKRYSEKIKFPHSLNELKKEL